MRCDDKLLVLFNKSFDLGLTFADAVDIASAPIIIPFIRCNMFLVHIHIALHIPRRWIDFQIIWRYFVSNITIE